MTADPLVEQQGQRVFRQTLLRVMAVQVVALAALWLLQGLYTP